MIEELEDIGLKKNEALVYYCVLIHGPSSAAQISKQANLSRTAVYPILESLSEHNLIMNKKNLNSSTYMATSPTSIYSMLTKEEAEIKRKKQIAKKLANKLSIYDTPKAEYVFGRKNIENIIFDSIDLWFKSTKEYDNTLWGYQTPSFICQYDKWAKEYWKRKDPEHKINLFSHLTDHEKKVYKKVPGREIRSLPDKMYLKSTIWVNGDFITLINDEKNNEYLLQIKDKALSSDLRNIFTLLWNNFSNRRGAVDVVIPTID